MSRRVPSAKARLRALSAERLPEDHDYEFDFYEHPRPKRRRPQVEPTDPENYFFTDDEEDDDEFWPYVDDELWPDAEEVAPLLMYWIDEAPNANEAPLPLLPNPPPKSPEPPLVPVPLQVATRSEPAGPFADMPGWNFQDAWQTLSESQPVTLQKSPPKEAPVISLDTMLGEAEDAVEE